MKKSKIIKKIPKISECLGNERKTEDRITNEYQMYKPLPYNMGPNLLDNLVTEDNRPHINS